MKKLISTATIIFWIVLLCGFTLNRFGHIEYSEQQITAEFYMEDGEYYIRIDDKILIGNSLFKIENGYLTLTGEHENIPTWMRIYDEDGNLKFYQEFRKVINLQLSADGKFAVFFDTENLQVLNSTTLKLKEYGRSTTFAVNSKGQVLWLDEQGVVHFKEKSFKPQEQIKTVLFFQQTPYLISKHEVFRNQITWQKITTFTEEIFEARVIDDKLFLVLKNGSDFTLHSFSESKLQELLDRTEYKRAENRLHEPINAPLNYGAVDYPFPIGNSYAEIQQYGNTPYLHPGVDFLGDDNQEVYAVHDGFVKAILTTGGAPYWRVAIANEDSPDETEGYLYAHLNENSITVNVGDEVQSGDLLGTLYPWGYYDFTHIHFARVFCSGQTWYGDWWTTENNLVDVTNIQDTIPPVFEDAVYQQKFAFRNSAGSYLDPMNLSGEFDIIVKCHDIANSNWRIDLHDLSYSLHPHNNPDSTLFQKFAYVYDFDLDTYINSTVDWMILNTIYSRDGTCYSIGNYDEREYYHVITNSNGDSLITQEDAAECFDSSQFSDDLYLLKVTARDASLNTTVDSMMINFNNGVNTENLPEPEINLTNYPNPFNPSTTITFNLTSQNAKEMTVEIYNLKGQKVKTFQNHQLSKSSKQQIVWNGDDDNNRPVSSGLYFCKLKSGSLEVSKKMILMK